LRACLLCLCLSLSLVPAAHCAQDRDPGLEKWQQRLLDALEESGKSSQGSAGDAYRSGATDEGASQAAERARQRYGGRVLAVGRVGDRYRVRLLLDGGRVITVEIE
jgi:hypothetical protein